MREALADAAGHSLELEHVNELSLALERLSRGGIHIVLLDLSLPDSAGLLVIYRDNLLLTVVMQFLPLESVQSWQMGR